MSASRKICAGWASLELGVISRCYDGDLSQAKTHLETMWESVNASAAVFSLTRPSGSHGATYPEWVTQSRDGVCFQARDEGGRFRYLVVHPIGFVSYLIYEDNTISLVSHLGKEAIRINIHPF